VEIIVISCEWSDIVRNEHPTNQLKDIALELTKSLIIRLGSSLAYSSQVYAVLHDWNLDWRTGGSGVTNAHGLAVFKNLILDTD